MNNWWGKLIGAFLGYLIAGPAGAFFGLLIGNFFDKGLSHHLSNPHLLYHAEKRQAVQKVFFESTFSIMGHIAKADGHVSAREIQMAQTLMNEMRLNKKQKELAKRLFTEGKEAHFKLDLVLNQLQKTCRDNRELLKVFIDIQYRAAQVDGLTPKKIQALDAILAHLGFARLHQQYRFYEDFTQTYSQQDTHQNSSSSSQQRNTSYAPKNNLAHAYALLEITPATSKQEAKKIYRRLLSKNHPDKLIAQGLPESMIKIANEKTHNIMKAYELICSNKGWK